MARRRRKLESPVTLFAAIEQEQHEVLRSIAFSEHKSIAAVTREALTEYVDRYRAKSEGRRANVRAPRA